ncbi:MAG: hypothetical protein HYT87_01805 [Nitrospirae bacterium]|nr:hypothetical protein [Nitrospirota bacterium]
MKGLGGSIGPVGGENGEDEGLPMAIRGCPNGCVCLSFGVAAVHLQPEEFVRFMGLASDALARMWFGQAEGGAGSTGSSFQ